MKVAWFWADLPHEWISSMWRVQFPHTGLLKAGIESRQDAAHEFMTHDWHPFSDWADVIILERLFFKPWSNYVGMWKKMGKKVFATFDDAYWLMPDYMRTKPTWNEETVGQFFRGLGKTDGIFVPSIGLANELRNSGIHKKRIHFVPNYVDVTFPGVVAALESKKLRTDDRFVIGWGGSHHHSIEPLVPVFKRVVKVEPRVQIWIIGNVAAYNLLVEIPMEHKRFFGPMPYGNYLSLIKEFDVYAIPLHGRYDGCRSWIKPLEAALMGVPWVATDSRIYKDCKGGRLVKGKEEWIEALLAPERADKGWALEQDITRHVGEYLDVLNSHPHLR